MSYTDPLAQIRIIHFDGRLYLVDILSPGSSQSGTCSEEDEMSGLGVVGTCVGLLLALDACSQETTIQQ